MTPSPVLHLRDLLVSMFQPAELEMFVALHVGDDLLPVGVPTLEVFAFIVARALEQRGLTRTPAFWEMLIRERPARAAVIMEVEREFLRPWSVYFFRVTSDGVVTDSEPSFSLRHAATHRR